MVIMCKFLPTSVSETAAWELIRLARKFQSEVWGYERKSPVLEAEPNMTLLVPHTNLAMRKCVPRFTSRLIWKRFDVLCGCLRVETF